MCPSVERIRMTPGAVFKQYFLFGGCPMYSCSFIFLDCISFPSQTLICCSACSLFASFPLSHSPVIASCHVWTCRGPQALFFSLSVPSLSLSPSPSLVVLFTELAADWSFCFDLLCLPCTLLPTGSVTSARATTVGQLSKQLTSWRYGEKEKNNGICLCFYRRALSVFCPIIFFSL